MIKADGKNVYHNTRAKMQKSHQYVRKLKKLYLYI